MSDTDEIEARSAHLMRSLAAGEDAALTELVALWQEPVLRFVYRYLRNECEAREITHDTFLRLHTKRASFQSGRAFRPWIFTIAGNLARSRRRWWRRHPSTAWFATPEGASDKSELASPALAPDADLLRQERMRAVQAALEALPHDLKTVILLQEYEELAYREIAEVLGCNERAVETKLMRAREKLRHSLNAYLRAEPALPGTAAPVTV